MAEQHSLNIRMPQCSIENMTTRLNYEIRVRDAARRLLMARYGPHTQCPAQTRPVEKAKAHGAT